MTGATLLTGRPGQALAVGLACLGLALVWFAAAAPLWRWFDHQQILLSQRQALLQQARDIAAELPDLRLTAARQHDGNAIGGAALVPGASDALAAAALQESLQRLAGNAGVSLAAVETMPATAAGHWRKVSLRISLNAPWPVLIDFLQAVENAPVRVLIDDIHLHSGAVDTTSLILPIRASMMVSGFRASQVEPERLKAGT